MSHTSLPRSPRFRRTAPVVAVAAAAALTLAGCSSSSGGKKAAESGAAVSAGKADTPRMTIAMVTHAPSGDTFWDTIRKGAEAAAAKDNVKLIYSNDETAADQANLVQNAIDQKVDGIAVTLAKPDAMKAVVAKAEAAGIPVVGFNAGLSEWKKQGLLSFFGQDESVSGQALGTRLNDTGAKHALCVVQAQGDVNLEQRCAGVKKTFSGTTDNLYVNGTDMPSVKSTITAKLAQDKSIDEVVTLGAPFALTAAQATSESGSKAKVATFDLNKDLISAIEKGSIQFAVDQQPYLQGYLAVDSLWLYKTNGNYSGGGEQPILTGPAFVDKSNVDAVAQFAAKGTR
ncbi:sugar ABC transporter substrate-binding protein [Streptomyces sp. RLB3-17]|uniref:sugar ABC transporter substrate-binding protein n=1 Tax=unclassified Streptomyces TaxID=2593676 RepID=UPI001162764E|nr:MULTISPECIES: sugar ABC transporter substrate-binding protein [unclassified Streptomyces]QDN54918.1 sugar ABC transporter substrate-binding protein [Streptomyces sp. S1D4-20]QDN65098.1 sugar ABC transporter substrate-binding protein [Streptomyces sp. S1D4-14]QDO37511.1 sugar ABC transporter substrate-binding protein [Streptomyces sp. RLB3-17]QDO47505.1 sugar ABC transporter substrate-binding protein [Streptomyces sp. RLB3-5]QDO57744.1 sugar ABC transporter substrate-binding protein [Strepto